MCVVNGLPAGEDCEVHHLQNMLRFNAHNKVFVYREKGSSLQEAKGEKGDIKDINKDIKKAHLVYETVSSLKQSSDRAQSLLWVRPTTGRKHQIRVQLSHAGLPIVGDVRYGAPQIFKTPVRDIALHALALQISHPVSKERMLFTAMVPSYWSERFCPATVRNTEKIAKLLQKEE